LFTDQTLEQEIKLLKQHGGMVGLSTQENALERLIAITPHLKQLVMQFMEQFPGYEQTKRKKEHYQLTGSMSTRIQKNATSIRESIKLHADGNPFQNGCPLRNLASSALVPEDCKDDILNFGAKGQVLFKEFVAQRLTENSPLSLWDPMKKTKHKTFSNFGAKVRVRIQDKVVKLKEERDLLGRCLIIQRSRPELVPNLEIIIGTYELSSVPRSLCATDGSLNIPTDKASLLHALEPPKGQPCSDGNDTSDRPTLKKVLIIDAMAVLQGITKTPAMLRLSDYLQIFIKRIEDMGSRYNEVHVIFDRYQDQSLKDKTREKGSTSSVEYRVHLDMKLTMTIRELLSASSTKAALTLLFAKELLNHLGPKKFLVVAYADIIEKPTGSIKHLHEEADTLLALQVISVGASCSIDVWSPDTDVFILLMDLVANNRLGSQSELAFVTGRGAKRRRIDLIECVKSLGSKKSKGLVGFHNFTGADWGGKFVGISKKTWINAYKNLGEEDPALQCFINLGNGPIHASLINDELPPEISPLEQFTCKVYCKQGPESLPQLRWHLFQSKNSEGAMLPPTRAALLPHIVRANYISTRDKSYVTPRPQLPHIEENGWQVKEEKFLPIHCLNPPAPLAVLELRKCGCKVTCGGRCTCSKHGLPCTPLCKCYGRECTNCVQSSIDAVRIDSDSDED
jgi:hypothetical protein